MKVCWLNGEREELSLLIRSRPECNGHKLNELFVHHTEKFPSRCTMAKNLAEANASWTLRALIAKLAVGGKRNRRYRLDESR